MAKKVPDLYCSFCRRSAARVDKLIGGPGVYICDRCVKECNSILKGRKGSGFAGWASLTDEDLLASLGPAANCVRSLDGSVRDQVEVLRERGVSWARIGEQLGVTRQAAQQRFGS